MIRFLYNGLPGIARVDGWELATLVYPEELNQHPVPAPEGTGHPRIIVSNEENGALSLSLMWVEEFDDDHAVAKQIAMLTALRDKYPNEHITVYGMPYSNIVWQCEKGDGEPSYQVWAGIKGKPADRQAMMNAAEYLGDLMLGRLARSKALLPVKLNGWSPSLYAAINHDGKCLEAATMELELANFIAEYTKEKYDHWMSIIPFVSARRCRDTRPLLSDEAFEITQIGPLRQGLRFDGVFYFTNDGRYIEAARDPSHEHHEECLKLIGRDVPAGMSYAPIDWDEITNWYNALHMRRMKRIVEKISAP